jgi:glycosyltransferase involved in cell wall biosynthesis
MPRIRVCQLITELQPAGAERVVYELATRLDRSEFDVQVAGLAGGAMVQKLSAAGVKVTALGARGKWDVLKLSRLVRLLRDERIDLLHTHLFHADVMGRLAARRAGVPHLVHTVHVAERRFRPWQYLWACWAAGRCDRIVCVSNAVREHHAARTHLPLENYQVIYNGVDLDAYRPDPLQRQLLRQQWGVGPRQFVLAFIGRLDVQKNPLLFLAAWAALRQRGHDVRAVLAGDGPQRPAVEQFLRRHDHAGLARWLGRIDYVSELLAACDVLVAPSRWEGFGLMAAEAMAAGVSVVATRVPGLSELIEEGASGLLVNSEDLPGLVAAIERLLGDPPYRQRLTEAARQRVRERFSIAANIAAHERLYHEVIGAQSKGA